MHESAFGPKQTSDFRTGPRLLYSAGAASKRVYGILTPIIIGTIAEHQSAAGSLDADGIANIFATQRDNIVH